MSGRAAQTRCIACRAPVIPLVYVGLPWPLSPDTAGTSRLFWCSRDGRLRPVWRSSHPPDCPHRHLSLHHCPVAAPIF